MQNKNGKKNPTIIDIAKLSGYSKSTVSNVLRNEPFVKKSTKNKILKIINDIGYKPNEIARSLVLKKTSSFIGLIISDTTNPFFSEVTSGVEAEAKKNNHSIILCNTNYIEEEEKKYIDILIRNRVSGIILATATRNDKNVRYLLEIGYPLVLIAREVENTEANLVSVDNYQSAKMAVNYLIQKGHKSIAHFTVNEEVLGLIRRIDGYKSSLKDNKITINESFILKNEMSIEGGYESAEKLLKLDKKPTAIFAADDTVAIGAMDCLFEKGYRIPDDFSIIGYDNIKLAGLKLINLTTIDQPKYEMGVKAVQILFDKIKKGYNNVPAKYILESRIIERGSVADLKNRL